MVHQIQGLFMTMRLWDILDILVVAFFFTFLAEAGVGALSGIGSFAIWIWSFYLDVTERIESVSGPP